MSDEQTVSDETRYERGVAPRYVGDGIEVSWEPGLCTHEAMCIAGAPEVFRPMARPWIRLEDADPDHVAAVIARCPTGALRARRTDGTRQEEDLLEGVEIRVEAGGPLLVHGTVIVLDAEGKPLREAVRLSLCRCGASRRKPYCDGSHRLIRFDG